jgi:hypothetical protein
MTLDAVGALAERQKTVMDQSYRMQYENRGFDLKFLPEITYETAILTLDRGKTVGPVRSRYAPKAGRQWIGQSRCMASRERRTMRFCVTE